MAIDFMSAVPADQRPELEPAQMATPAPAAARTTPTQADPFDLAPIKAKLNPYAVEIDGMAQAAAAVIVNDQASNVTAVEMAGQAKKLFKLIEDARKAFVDPPNAFIKSVNGLAKGFQGTLTDIETGLKRKIGAFQARVEMERREMERRAQEEARKLQEQINKEAAEKQVEAPQVEMPVMPKAPMMTRTAEGSASIRKEWKHELVDQTLIPREYLIVDESAIRRAVKAGIREIPGIRIFEDSIVAIRN